MVDVTTKSDARLGVFVLRVVAVVRRKGQTGRAGARLSTTVAVLVCMSAYSFNFQVIRGAERLPHQREFPWPERALDE